MKKLLYVLLAAAVFAALSGCGGQSGAAAREAPEPGDSGDGSGTDSETSAELLQVLDDFRVYYNGFYAKASAPAEYFYEGPELLLVTRNDEADTVGFLEELAAGTDAELSGLCGDLAAMYGEIHAFPAESKQEEYADLCGRFYGKMERLAAYLGEPLPEGVLPLPEPGTVENPEMVPVPPAEPERESAPAPQSQGGGGTETIANSRWDSDDGYTLIFYHGQAFLGTEYESDEVILSNGKAATYEIQDGTIRFQAVGDPRTAVFRYDGTSMEDTNGEMFEQGSLFTESYGLT